MVATAKVVVDLEQELVVTRYVFSLHLRVSAVAEDVARGVPGSWLVTRTYGAATVCSRSVCGDVWEVDDVGFGCCPQCTEADVKNLADHLERALTGVPHVVAHCKQSY